MKLYELVRLIDLTDDNLKNTLELYFIGNEMDDFVDVPVNIRSLMRFADAEVVCLDTDVKEDRTVIVVGLSNKPVDYLDYNFLRDPAHSYHRG